MEEIIAKTYYYFLRKKLPTPYFRTIIIFCGFTILHCFVLFEIFPFPKYFNPFRMSKIPIENYIAGLIFLGLIYSIFTIIFKKKQLEKYSFTESQIKYFMPKMFLYFVLLFAAIIILSTMHLREKW